MDAVSVEMWGVSAMRLHLKTGETRRRRLTGGDHNLAPLSLNLRENADRNSTGIARLCCGDPRGAFAPQPTTTRLSGTARSERAGRG